MPRFKSILRAQSDARTYPFHVDVPVPGTGLGARMDVIAAWIGDHIGSDWRQHGERVSGQHVARYMFRRQAHARCFQAALAAGAI